MEVFHATFQAALNDEFEALVRDLRTAAAAVADPRHDDPDAADAPARAVSASEEHGSTSAVVSELVARWTFILAAYRAHVAAEDEDGGLEAESGEDDGAKGTRDESRG